MTVVSRRTFPWMAGLLAIGSVVLAQPVENVTVSGTKEPPELAAEHFVQRFSAPSQVTGKLARWDEGVCPVTVGLASKYAAYISERVRAVAKEVGAPVSASADCRANIEIVFTTMPQAMADVIRRDHPFNLGYASSEAQRDALAKVTHPIQAWYTNAIRDLRGNLIWDSPRMIGSGSEIQIPCDWCSGKVMHLSSAIAATTVTGGRLKDGLRSIFNHIIIVAEPAKLGQYDVGTLADYIALLSLSQVTALDTCQPLGSIVNLLAKDCPNAPTGLSAGDISFLQGLYKMSADGNLRMQQDAIAQSVRQGQEK